MKLPRTHTLKEISEFLDCTYAGNADHEITGINEIHVVEPGDIVFVDHPKYYNKALQSAATTVLINKEVEVPEGKGLLISDDPFRDFNKLTRHFNSFERALSSISDTALIGEGTIVQPNAFIGNHVKIGRNCIIHSNVSIYDYTVIGDDVIIHANAVIGADAFYYKKRPEGYDKLVSGGKVVIEDKVEIGAGSTIDRGVSGETLIGFGTKIDNNVQIGMIPKWVNTVYLPRKRALPVAWLLKTMSPFGVRWVLLAASPLKPVLLSTPSRVWATH